MTEYVREKLCLLRQLGIRATMEQKCHLFELSSEIAVDNAVRKIILDAEEK